MIRGDGGKPVRREAMIRRPIEKAASSSNKSLAWAQQLIDFFDSHNANRALVNRVAGFVALDVSEDDVVIALKRLVPELFPDLTTSPPAPTPPPPAKKEE